MSALMSLRMTAMPEHFSRIVKGAALSTAALTLGLTLAGCGYKGDLTQPPAPSGNSTLTAPPETLPASTSRPD